MFLVRVLLSWAVEHLYFLDHYLGALWAWSDLQGCTGAMLGVADVGAGTGATSGKLVSVVLGFQASQVQQEEAVAIVQAW